MAPFRSGIGLLATNVDAPIVPIRIDGLFELKQRRKYFSRPGQVTVTFGEPVRFAADEAAATIARELERRIASL
jgi:long-chain acyl-CoA synthetase